MERRSFIRQSMLASAGVTLFQPFLEAEGSPKIQKLTILHTNDMHSRIDPFPMNGTKNAGLGGMARRASMIKKIRAENENVLLLDSGDIFQGTPYFNFFGGELEYKLMSEMGYDASTLGNHDFDNGVDGLDKMLPNAKFDILNANYDFKNNIFKNRFLPYKIFNKGGLKIGVFGIGIDLEGLVPENLHKSTIYQDPVAKSREMVQELNKKGCNLIICLSHLGYKYNDNKISDISLTKQVSGIDLVLGGHTHTFLDQPVPVVSDEGYQTLIGQVGWAGINLGKIDYTFSAKKEIKKIEGSALIVSETANG